MAVTDMIMWGLAGGGGSALLSCSAAWVVDKISDKKAIASEPEKIDGRTRSEWYEIVKLMGKEECERMARPALDGLEGSKDGIGGWDVKALIGDELYRDLQQEWYPACKHCYKACEETCYLSRKEREGYVGKRKNPIAAKFTKPKPIEQWDGNIKKPRVDVSQVIYRQNPSLSHWRMERDNDSWQLTTGDIRAFQRRKGWVPDGIVGSNTREALIRYMQAGNPWPVTEGRVQGAEAQKLAMELEKWRTRDGELNW